MTVQAFLNELGGTAQVARDLAIPLTTVASWGQNNKVPKWRMPTLAELAVRKGKGVPAELAEQAA